jgi:hypothetical protein
VVSRATGTVTVTVILSHCRSLRYLIQETGWELALELVWASGLVWELALAAVVEECHIVEQEEVGGSHDK